MNKGVIVRGRKWETNINLSLNRKLLNYFASTIFCLWGFEVNKIENSKVQQKLIAFAKTQHKCSTAFASHLGVNE